MAKQRNEKVRKAVFPVAGLGSRFLPATKANPKEMLPIVDKPLIQYAVEEAIQAGFTEMIFVTSSSKRSIEDHFDVNYELESRLRDNDKQEMLALTRGILPAGINCVYIRQAEPRGLGDAILRTKSLIGDESFAILLADDLFDCDGKGCLQQMLDIYNATHQNIIAVEEVTKNEVQKYGIVDITEPCNPQARIKDIVEKPKPANAPSNLGVAGRYILSSNIFQYLENLSPGAGNELQLTDAISLLLKEEEVYAYKFSGKRYDCGDKLGYLKATLNYALKHPELAPGFSQYLKEMIALTPPSPTDISVK